MPFVSKAIGVPLAKIAAKIMAGRKLELGSYPRDVPTHISVKEAVFPFNKFPGVDTMLGPEMKSTGEVMGIDNISAWHSPKLSWLAACDCRKSGKVFISVRDEDKEAAALLARRLYRVGFRSSRPRERPLTFQSQGYPTEVVKKVQEGGPHIGDQIRAGDIAMVVNTPEDARSHADSFAIRRYAWTISSLFHHDGRRRSGG